MSGESKNAVDNPLDEPLVAGGVVTAGDPLHTEDLLRVVAQRNSNTAIDNTFDDFEDQFVVYRHHRVNITNTQNYEKWVEHEVQRLQREAKALGFCSHMNLHAKGEYLHAFRFADYRSVMRWLRSDEHNKWAQQAKQAGYREVGHDVSEGGASFLPTSMRRVAKRILTTQHAQDVKMSSVLPGQSLLNLNGDVVIQRPDVARRRCAPFQPCGNTCCGKPYAIEGPPPEWRQGIVIWCSATMLFFPYVIWILPTVYGAFLPVPPGGPPIGKQPDIAAPEKCTLTWETGANSTSFFPGECGKPRVVNDIFFWGFLITDMIVNTLMVWFGVPLWSIFCRPFTHGLPRFSQCGLNFEPFTCLDDGLPCFRPRKKPWEALLESSNERLKMLEDQLNLEARMRASLRNRLTARISQLEGKKGAASSLNNVTRRRADSTVTAEVTRRVEAEVKNLDTVAKANSSRSQSSVYIRTWVTQANFSHATLLLHDIARAMHTESKGFKGMLVLTPGPQDTVTPFDPDRIAGMKPTAPFDLIFEYDTLQHLKEWMSSDTRLNYLVLGGPVFRGPPEGGSPVVTVEVHDALSSLFVGGAKQYKKAAMLLSQATDTGRSPQVLQYHPQTWKMWCVLNVAFGVVGLPVVDLWLNKPLYGPVWLIPPKGEATIWKIALLMAIVVPIILYVSVPSVIYFASGWLFEPWHLSKNPVLAVMQEGFPCCLATGPRNEGDEGDDEDKGLELSNV